MMLVDEGANVLMGISRNFVYEAFTRGEIPRNWIDEGILVSKVALERPFECAGADAVDGK